MSGSQKLVGIHVCADGAAVNMGVRSGATKQLQDIVPHLLPVHCCAHRVELALNTISNQIDYFKTLEGTRLELYKLYHKSPLCWSGLQEVGQVLQVKILSGPEAGWNTVGRAQIKFTFRIRSTIIVRYSPYN